MESVLRQIGSVRSSLDDRTHAPKQGWGSGQEALIEILPEYVEGLQGIAAGDDVLVLTWLHLGDRSTLRVHPRDDPANPMTGVFATRSADRPNPIGLHRVTVLGIEQQRLLRVEGLEAVDGTPVVDIKPLLPWERGSRP
ncbi:MAG TPA: tRNA (N6-threonylcarbamoyladenosine(37)-N6)-methyltransferase TrmO [Vicinamibacterales bacterium]|nr:tRNA (N6-threonylcarbamoyladenosine(37)-N6)-methyltransferase TrmO [Vicinamibacterales bacterium]